MEVKVCECPKPLCRYRWIPRVVNAEPKECPACKHRFTASWGLKVKCWNQKISSMDDLKQIKREIREWNDKVRFTS